MEKKIPLFKIEDEKLVELRIEIRNLRDMIDGELNCVVVTDNRQELKEMTLFLFKNVSKLFDLRSKEFYYTEVGEHRASIVKEEK